MKFFKQIKKNVLFQGLTDDEISTLFDILNARIVKASPRDIVVRPGDDVHEICIVLMGNLVEFSIKTNGQRQIVRSLIDGNMFGFPNCFSETSTFNNFVTAVTDTYLLFINADSTLNVHENSSIEYEKFVKNLVKALSSKINDLESNNSFITIKGMRKKIAKFIYGKYLEQNNLVVKLGVDRNGMARYLNVSRPSMSREMIRMREEGIFDFHKDMITIKNLDKLRDISENS